MSRKVCAAIQIAAIMIGSIIVSPAMTSVVFGQSISGKCYDKTSELAYVDDSPECQELRKQNFKRLECEALKDKEKGKGYTFVRAFNNACVTLPDFMQTLVNYVMFFSSIIAGFMLLQGGLKIVTARGNPSAIAEARSTILNSAIGLILLASAYVIINFLSNTFSSGVTPDINLLGPFVP